MLMGGRGHEILSEHVQGVWRCPACQDLCNCSGATCSRYQKGLEPTEQLHHEAVSKGFKSVCHSFHGQISIAHNPCCNPSASGQLWGRPRWCSNHMSLSSTPARC